MSTLMISYYLMRYIFLDTNTNKCIWAHAQNHKKKWNWIMSIDMTKYFFLKNIHFMWRCAQQYIFDIWNIIFQHNFDSKLTCFMWRINILMRINKLFNIYFLLSYSHIPTFWPLSNSWIQLSMSLGSILSEHTIERS